MPSGRAPALPFQSRRILSALRTVNLPHYHIFPSARYPLPNLHSSNSSLTRTLIILMHSNHLFFLPTLGKRVTPSSATTALGAIVSHFSQQKPQWQDASSPLNIPWVGARTQAKLLLQWPKFQTRGGNPSLVELANPLLTTHADLGLFLVIKRITQSHKI